MQGIPIYNIYDEISPFNTYGISFHVRPIHMTESIEVGMKSGIWIETLRLSSHIVLFSLYGYGIPLIKSNIYMLTRFS